MTFCAFCGEYGSIRLKYARLWVCKKHFVEYIQRKVRKTCEKYELLPEKGKLGVAISGGKDSLACLHLLNTLFKHKLLAIHINLGINSYSGMCSQICTNFCKEMGIDLVTLELKKEYGFSAKDLKRIDRKVCSLCGVVKRYLINKVAHENGCKYIATGHNADDEASLIMMNFLSGNIEQMARLGPKTQSVEELRLVGRIKPLYRNLEFENKLYCDISGIQYVKMLCPVASISEQKQYQMKDLLNTLEKRMPEIKLRIITNFLKKIKPVLKQPKMEVKTCKLCGYPTITDVCKFCRIVDKLKP